MFVYGFSGQDELYRKEYVNSFGLEKVIFELVFIVQIFVKLFYRSREYRYATFALRPKGIASPFLLYM